MSRVNCYCGGEKDYEGCCGLYHNKKAWPKTALELMRSRYSAYCVGEYVYLLESLHPKQRIDDGEIYKDICKNKVDWLGLEVISVLQGEEKDKQGKVEFKATYRSEGTFHVLHELSRFRRFGGKWYYFDGKIIP